MYKLLVIADDFTGAMDTGVQFSKKGVPTLVLTVDQLPFEGMGGVDCKGAEVLVVDTESRHLSANEAHDIVAKVTARARVHGLRHFYKKTDSALRGNIGAELGGMMAGGGKCLTFVPAFPKSRRVTRNGIHYIDGVEVGRSIFSKDPFTPVTHSAVADIVHMQTDIQTENISSDAYEKIALEPERQTIRVLDSESMDDIEALGAHLKRGGNMELLAGCAGFAEILPELLDLPKHEFKWEKKADNVLVVSGSVNPISIEQIAYGESIGFSMYFLSHGQKLTPSYPDSAECEIFVRNIVSELERNRRVIIGAVKEASVLETPEEGVSENEASKLVAGNIGEITLRILRGANVGNLVVFGGDTLHGVLSKIGGDGVVPLAEISPGVAAAKILSERYDGVVITKSGGLGDKDVLRQIEKFVFGREESL